MNVVLFGSTGSANVALERLLESSFTLLAVFTRSEEGPCPHYACENLGVAAAAAGIPVFEDVLPAESAAAQEIFSAQAIDVLASVGYHRKIPPEVYTRAQHAVNVHPSLLPAYRGSATANWSIINREPLIGATVHRLAPAIDTGAILMQRVLEIGPRETAGQLRQRLATLMGDLLMSYLCALDRGAPMEAVAQDVAKASRFPGIGSDDARLDLRQTIEEVEARFRGVSPWPGAWIELDGLRYLVVALDSMPENRGVATPGAILAREGERMTVAAVNGVLRLKLRKIG